MIDNTHRPTKRVLDILEILSDSHEGLSLTEIAESILAPKSSIFPVIRTMLERKFIILDPRTLKYKIGISTFSVGNSYSNNNNALDFINDEMESIVKYTGEICQMGILDKGQVLYVAKVDSDEMIRLISHIGKRLPAYCTSLGKALLSQHDIEEIQGFYPKGLKAYTKNTITNISDLEKQLVEIRNTNVATENEEITEHINCIAVPLSLNGKIVAALSVSIPSFRATEEKINLVTKMLLNSKGEIEAFFKAADVNINEFIF